MILITFEGDTPNRAGKAIALCSLQTQFHRAVRLGRGELVQKLRLEGRKCRSIPTDPDTVHFFDWFLFISVFFRRTEGVMDTVKTHPFCVGG